MTTLDDVRRLALLSPRSARAAYDSHLHTLDMRFDSIEVAEIRSNLIRDPLLSTEVYTTHAQILLQEGKSTAALELSRRVLDLGVNLSWESRRSILIQSMFAANRAGERVYLRQLQESVPHDPDLSRDEYSQSWLEMLACTFTGTLEALERERSVLLRCRDLMVARGDNYGVAHAEMRLGHSYRAQEQLVNALDHYHTSLRLFEDFGSRVDSLGVLVSMATAYRNLQQAHLATDLAEKVLEEAELEGMTERADSARHLLSTLYVRAGRHNEARMLLTEVIQSAKRVQSKQIEAVALATVAVVYLELEQWSDALETAKRGRSMSTNLGNLGLETLFTGRELLACIGLSDIRRARIVCKHLDELLSRGLPPSTRYESLRIRGDFSMFVDETSSAVQYYESAISCATATDYRFDRTLAYRRLAEAYKRIGDVEACLVAYTEALREGEKPVIALFADALSSAESRRRSRLTSEVSASILLVQRERELQTLEREVEKSFGSQIQSHDGLRRLMANLRANQSRDGRLGNVDSALATADPNLHRRIASALPQLTSSERRLCMLIMAGLSTKDIARTLMITPASVKTLRSRIRKKIGITDDKDLGQTLFTIC